MAEKQIKILVTGASGFIGSFIIEEGLKLGYEMWAGVRGTSSRGYLRDERIRFAELDLSNPDKLSQQLEACKTEMGGEAWDYIVHAAGATKCLNENDFYKTNTLGTGHFIDALKATGMIPERFIFISSLSIFGAIREKAVRKATPDNPWIYAPILLSDKPMPNTAYGQSKLLAEQWLEDQKDVPYTILRPTGVYGPRERDYFLMAQSIKQHIDIAAGLSRQEITFVYVRDVVQAVFRSMKSAAAEGKAYFLSDGNVYNSRTYSDLVQKELGNPFVLHLKLPLPILRIVCWIGGKIGHLTGKITALNDDKYYILSQRNWQCDIEPAKRDFNYAPEWPLEKGVKESMDWYKKSGWL